MEQQGGSIVSIGYVNGNGNGGGGGGTPRSGGSGSGSGGFNGSGEKRKKKKKRVVMNDGGNGIGDTLLTEDERKEPVRGPRISV